MIKKLKNRYLLSSIIFDFFFILEYELKALSTDHRVLTQFVAVHINLEYALLDWIYLWKKSKLISVSIIFLLNAAPINCMCREKLVNNSKILFQIHPKNNLHFERTVRI